LLRAVQCYRISWYASSVISLSVAVPTSVILHCRGIELLYKIRRCLEQIARKQAFSQSVSSALSSTTEGRVSTLKAQHEVAITLSIDDESLATIVGDLFPIRAGCGWGTAGVA
jgi:hypothetical protein